MPRPSEDDAARLVARRHPEWREWHGRWRWLLDSYDGGQRYRDAVYGYWLGLPVRNLLRHKREYPDPKGPGALAMTAAYPAGLAAGAADPGSAGGAIGTAPDAAQFALDDDYELRRARTPVPTFVREAVDAHLSAIYGEEVTREGPPAVEAWWADVDGQGTAVDDWMESLVGPLFMTLGQLDVLVDHPRAPDGAGVETRADLQRLDLNRAVASYILPENLLWWEVDSAGRYTECLVQEHDADRETGKPVRRLRHWQADGSALLDPDGSVLDWTPHGYGMVPIRRCFFRRRPRYRNVGLSRYEGTAERQREYYNRDSELILSDTTQAHPLLQGPEDYVQADGSVPVGPGWLLPKKKNTQGGSASYEGFEVVDFPKGAADSIRENLRMIRDEVDRDNCLTKPAGAAGTTGQTVAQSGVSKQLDHVGGHKLAGQIAKALAERVEMAVAELVLVVLNNRPLRPGEVDAVRVTYPSAFSLQGAADLAAGLDSFQGLLGTSGGCPEVETVWLQKLARANLPGRSDDEYAAFDAEIRGAVEAKAAAGAEAAESPPAPPRAAAPDESPPGDDDAGTGTTPDTGPEYSAWPGSPGYGAATAAP